MIITSIIKPENRQDVDAALAAVSALTETIVDEPRPASGAVSSSLQQRLALRLARRPWTGYIGAPILSLFNIQTWTRACWKKNLCRCSVEDDRLSGWSSTFHRFLYRGTVRDNNTGPKEKHKIILPLRNFCWKENKTMSVMFKAGAWWGVLGSNKLLIVSCPEKDAFYTGAMVWNSFVVRRWQSLPQLLHVPYREVVDQAGVTKFRFCFDTKTKKMRPCRSEAKQLRCICSSCACETAKAFSQDSSDPLGPRDGLRPGGNRHEVLAGRRSLSRRNLAFGRGKQKKRSAIDRALDSKFLGWAYGQPQGVVVLRWPTLQEKGGEGVGWGQASTEACHTHRGGPTLLPGFRKRASVGTDAGAVAPVAPVRLAKQK